MSDSSERSEKRATGPYMVAAAQAVQLNEDGEVVNANALAPAEKVLKGSIAALDKLCHDIETLLPLESDPSTKYRTRNIPANQVAFGLVRTSTRHLFKWLNSVIGPLEANRIHCNLTPRQNCTAAGLLQTSSDLLAWFDELGHWDDAANVPTLPADLIQSFNRSAEVFRGSLPPTDYKPPKGAEGADIPKIFPGGNPADPDIADLACLLDAEKRKPSKDRRAQIDIAREITKKSGQNPENLCRNLRRLRTQGKINF